MKNYKIATIMITTMLGFSSAAVPVQAITELPAVSAAYNQKQMLTMLKMYDPDAYYIMKTEISNGVNVDFWFESMPTMFEAMNTGVHETYHSFTRDTAKNFYGENILAKKGKSYQIRYTGKIFRTSEVTSKIPKNLRSFRYDTYVSSGSTASANLDGAYGLLNEFSAYYWGCHAISSMTPYLKKYDLDGEGLKTYVGEISNDFTAYQEFRYWILLYMDYAKKHHKSTYKALLHNKAFCNAYTATETRFADLIETEKNGAAELNEAYKSRGYTVEFSDDGLVTWKHKTRSSDEFSIPSADYGPIKKELEKSKYVKMDQAIKKHADKSAAGKAFQQKNENADVTVRETKLHAPELYLTPKGLDAVDLEWECGSNADGYYIYKGINDADYTLVATINDGSVRSWRDTSPVEIGVKYYYKIKSFRNDGQKVITSDFSDTVSHSVRRVE